jgi:hypothetical protein
MKRTQILTALKLREFANIKCRDRTEEQLSVIYKLHDVITSEKYK